ncbi:MAG: sensor domain-containing diguanylate cyclase [Bacillota bacterium]
MTTTTVKKEAWHFALYWTVLTMTGIVLFKTSGYVPETPVQSLADVLMISLALSVFLVSWYSINWSEHLDNCVIAVAFLGVALLNGFALLSNPQIPVFFTPNSEIKALLFELAGGFIAAAGLFAGGAVGRTHRTSPSLRYNLLALGLAAGIVIIAVVFQSTPNPLLLSEKGLTGVWKHLNTDTMVLFGGALVLYTIKYFRLSEQVDLMMARVSGAFLGSWILFTFSLPEFRVFYIISLIYKLGAHFLLFHTVLSVVVKEPFFRLSQAQENLRWVNQNLDNLVSLRTADLRIVNERLKKVATTDFLTGALNRRHFLQKTQECWLQARLSHRPFSVLMIDIDGFKRINDALGHQVGDRCLQQFVSLARANLRQDDLIGRYGGDEFAVLLPQIDSSEAMRVSERIVSAIECNANPKFTVSIGIASFPRHGDDVDKILSAADIALYKAKSLGRNQYCVGGGELVG